MVAANRDEFFARRRPRRLVAIRRRPAIFAGRDLEAGGTWLGLGRSGRFAGLTNFAIPPGCATGPSRGALVADFLGSDNPPPPPWTASSAKARVTTRSTSWSPTARRWASTRQAAPRGCWSRASMPLSNHLLDPVAQGEGRQVPPGPRPRGPAGRHTAARTAPRRSPRARRRTAPHRRQPRLGAHALSAFIRAPGCGTRCSTVITRDRHGWARFTESTWDEVGIETGRVVETFQIDRA